MTTQSTVPVLVIGGYLGAGKTTLINELLSNTSSKIAVVVNDFGSINIDAALIASSNSDTIELTNGCICCAIGESLTDTMLAISDRPIQPDAVIIEASGVADPRAVAANAYLTGFHLAGIVVLVDVVNASRTAKNPLLKATFQRQLQSAHLLALTKEEEATAEQMTLCRSLISDIAAPSISRQFLTLQELFSHHRNSPEKLMDEMQSPFRTEVINDVSFAMTDELQQFCDALPPSVVRAKGVVEVDSHRYLVQRVGTNTFITVTSLPPTGLVVIYAD